MEPPLKRSTKILIALACLAAAALVGRALYSEGTAVQQVENVASQVTQAECDVADRDRTAFETGDARAATLDPDVVAGLLANCQKQGLALPRPAPPAEWARQYKK